MSFLEKLENFSEQLDKLYDQVLIFALETISIEVVAALSAIIPCQNISLGIPFVSMSTSTYILNMFIAGAMGAILKGLWDITNRK